MSNYRIKIQYDGSRYRGWQRQQGEKNTIQGRIEQVLSKQMGFPVTIDQADVRMQVCMPKSRLQIFV